MPLLACPTAAIGQSLRYVTVDPKIQGTERAKPTFPGIPDPTTGSGRPAFPRTPAVRSTPWPPSPPRLSEDAPYGIILLNHSTGPLPPAVPFPIGRRVALTRLAYPSSPGLDGNHQCWRGTHTHAQIRYLLWYDALLSERQPRSPWPGCPSGVYTASSSCLLTTLHYGISG